RPAAGGAAAGGVRAQAGGDERSDPDAVRRASRASDRAEAGRIQPGGCPRAGVGTADTGVLESAGGGGAEDGADQGCEGDAVAYHKLNRSRTRSTPLTVRILG